MAEDIERVAADRVSEIRAGKRSILDVVEEIGASLKSAVLVDRERAVDLLVRTVCQLSAEDVDPEQTVVLLEFLCAKLRDSAALLPQPVISAIHHLITLDRLPSGAEPSFLKCLMHEDCPVQGWTQRERLYCYQIWDWLLNRRLNGLIAMGADFVFMFMQAIEGERDPRCLMQTFALHEKVSATFPLGPYVSDMFD